MNTPGLVIDPEALAEQLARVREQRDHLDRVATWLEEGVTLFVGGAPPPQLVAAPEPEPQTADAPPPLGEVAQLPSPGPAEAEPAPLLRSRAGARDLDRQVLSVIRASKTPLAFAEIRAEVDASHGRVRSALQRLVTTEQIHAHGATASRRYSRLVSESAVKRAAGVASNAAKVQDGVDRVVFRDHVAKAIAADAGCLNEDRLAAALDADRGDVVEACSWLLEHNQIKRGDDGTYTRHVVGRARLRAAA